MGVTTGVSEDELKQQANRQNPPDTDAQFVGQPQFDSDFFSEMPNVTNTIGPTTTGTGEPFDSVGVGAQFGVKPGTAGTPPVQVGTIPGVTTDMTQTAEKKDYLDKALAVSIAGSKILFEFIKQLITSMRNRNIDDWAILSNTWLKTGGAMSGAGLAMIFIGIIGNISPLKLGGFGGGLFLSGLMVVVFGLGGLGVSLYLKMCGGEYAETGGKFEQLSVFDSMDEAVVDTSAGGFASTVSYHEEDDYDGDEEEDEDDEYEDDSFSSKSYDDIMEKLGYGSPTNDNFLFGDTEEDSDSVTGTVDASHLVDNINTNVPLITRKFLWETFKPFFPRLTVDFEKRTLLDLNSNESLSIGVNINKAIRILFPKAPDEEIECIVTEVMETKFSYEVRFNRPNVKVNIKAFEEELTNYFKKDATDVYFHVQLNVIRDEYYAIIPKGETNIVTLGDAFATDEVQDYYLNDKITIPIVVGVTDTGKLILKNAFSISSMSIIGTPRGGKSSYVNSLLFSMVTMCTPEDVMFLVIDPKESMLFRVFSYLPHVAGLHDATDVAGVLRSVLDGEGARRKKLLRDNRVENIKELRAKNIKLPMLYIIIDELVSVIEDAKSTGMDAEIKRLINMILTQLPSTGVGLIMIPHRTTGILTPTTRKNVAFKAIIRAELESVKEEFGLSKWDIPLPNPGDLVVRQVGELTGTFARSVVPVDPRNEETADKDSRDLMVAIARAWYKMGVEIPDTSYLGTAGNRDEQKIKEELEISVNPNKIQYELDLGGYRD